MRLSEEEWSVISSLSDIDNDDERSSTSSVDRTSSSLTPESIFQLPTLFYSRRIEDEEEDYDVTPALGSISLDATINGEAGLVENTRIQESEIGIQGNERNQGNEGNEINTANQVNNGNLESENHLAKEAKANEELDTSKATKEVVALFENAQILQFSDDKGDTTPSTSVGGSDSEVANIPALIPLRNPRRIKKSATSKATARVLVTTFVILTMVLFQLLKPEDAGQEIMWWEAYAPKSTWGNFYRQEPPRNGWLFSFDEAEHIGWGPFHVKKRTKAHRGSLFSNKHGGGAHARKTPFEKAWERILKGEIFLKAKPPTRSEVILGKITSLGNELALFVRQIVAYCRSFFYQDLAIVLDQTTIDLTDLTAVLDVFKKKRAALGRNAQVTLRQIHYSVNAVSIYFVDTARIFWEQFLKFFNETNMKLEPYMVHILRELSAQCEKLSGRNLQQEIEGWLEKHQAEVSVLRNAAKNAIMHTGEVFTRVASTGVSAVETSLKVGFVIFYMSAVGAKRAIEGASRALF